MADNNVEWSNEKMLKNSNNWSLEGDVALLNNLKKFSETVISGTESLSAKVDNLLNSAEHVSLKLQLTKNEFHSLRNTQFIENRVYEDDETIEDENDKAEENTPTEEERENALKKSIAAGLDIIEKYYDRVELSLSDSEGESNEKSYVLKAKDPYMDRPLPYLVGSEDWCKKWHVGLIISDSESESEKEDDAFSSGNDSETYLPKNRVVGSQTSSELDFINRNSGPVANSTFNDSQDRRTETFQSSEEGSEQSNSIPVKSPISSEKFAEQLAAKLGDVITGEKAYVKQPGINQQHSYDNLFSDEPPPLDDPNKTVLPKTRLRLFSDEKDLFADDNEDSKSNSLFANLKTEKPANLSDQSLSGPTNRTKISRGLFDDSDSSSEEDMLAVTEKRKYMNIPTKNPYMPPSKTTLPFLDDKPPEITPKAESESKKKPVGGVSIFGENVDIFQKKASKPKSNNLGLFEDSSEEDEVLVSKVPSAEAKDEATTKKSSLFDDITSQEESVENKSELVNSFDEPLSKDSGLFSAVKPTKKISLFDDDDDFLEEEKEIFSGLTKKKSLFDDSVTKSTKRPSKGLFDDFDEIEKVPDSTKQNFKAGLFDDLEEDLFTPKVTITKADMPKFKEVISKETDIAVSTENNVFLNEPEVASKETEVNDISQAHENMPKLKLEQKEIADETRQKVGLFDDSNEQSSFEEDNLFRSQKAEDNIPEPNESEKLPVPEQEEMVHKTRQTLDLFEDSKKQSFLEDDDLLSSQNNDNLNVNMSPERSDIEGTTAGKSKLEPNEAQSDIDVHPAIEFFDPTPPPVDWDATSDNSGESDTFSLSDGILDRTNYNVSQPTRSSLFDEAPPSLIQNNYSSGIVRDISVSGVDTSDSLFFPHASSSRRLSSDIFSEQQSQDSFFVSKNRVNSSTQNANLPNIAESWEVESKIEQLTPSGNIEDFNSASDSVFEKDENGSKGNMDLDNKKSEQDEVEKNPPAKASPGKLKHNLKINVGALLPGAARPRTAPTLVKSTSLDETDESEVVKRSKSSVSVQRPKSEIVADSEGFEHVAGTGVLHTITKDRAKIPIKRRPSTRKARQEAARKSMTDFTLYGNVEIEAEQIENEIEQNQAKINTRSISMVFDSNKIDDKLMKPMSNQTKPEPSAKDIFQDSASDNDEDLFLNTGSKQLSEPKPGIFSDKSDSDSELFGVKPKFTTRTNRLSKKPSIFDDSEDTSDDDDLFGSKTSSDTATSKVSQKTVEIKTANVKKLGNIEVTDFDPLSGFK